MAATTAVSKSGLTDRVSILPPVHIIFGSSAMMQTIRQKVEKVASSGVPILIQGDNGTGKGLLARFIHNRSVAPDAAFVKVNCAAIPGTLLESELFGYEKGAFTGAYSCKAGRVELADGGTLFLDGIDEIDMSLQAKLLQLLQDGQFSRIGGQEDRQVHLRVICATNRHLEQDITPEVAVVVVVGGVAPDHAVVGLEPAERECIGDRRTPDLAPALEDDELVDASFQSRCELLEEILLRPIHPRERDHALVPARDREASAEAAEVGEGEGHALDRCSLSHCRLQARQ